MKTINAATRTVLLHFILALSFLASCAAPEKPKGQESPKGQERPEGPATGEETPPEYPAKHEASSTGPRPKTDPAAATKAATQPAPLMPATVCCTQNYSRFLRIDLQGLEVREPVLRADPAATLTLSACLVEGRYLDARIKANAAGHGRLELCDGSAVLARSRYQVVAISCNVADFIGAEKTLPDGSTVFPGEMILSPHVSGLEVRFICLGPNVTVPDGLTERWIDSDTFVRIPSTGNSRLSFRMIQPPNGKWVPFTFPLYQDGEQIDLP